jgi:hypothetical protein
MAYATAGLKMISNTGAVGFWVLDTADAVGTVVGAGYVSDASTAGSGKGAAGRGVRIGDMMFVRVVSGGTVAIPTAFSDTGWYYVSTLSATTGAATLTACGAT